MHLNKSMMAGFFVGLGVPIAMVAGLLVAPASQAATTYTAADVATHSTLSNCWTIIDSNVYNLTVFATKHSGGSAVLSGVCGKDGSSTFHGQHGTGTSKLGTLSAYMVGALAGGATPTATPTPTPTSTTPASSGASYTLAQVSAHGTSSDCWSAINNNVYNLTSWINSHPGGKAVIIAMCGLDGSGYYNTQHGGDADVATTLRRFLIGSLAPTPAPTATASYTMAQIATHNTQANCWSLINGNVYDLTAFVNKHPGGTTQIISLCGINGTAAFTAKHSGSASANSTLGLYLIGTLSGSAAVTPVAGSYTLAQVALHNKTTDCWVALVGNVYDLTTWKVTHSGGESIINGVCGTDGTSTFYGKHASVASTKLAILDTYRKGTLSDYVPVAVPAPVTVDAVANLGDITMDQVKQHSTAADCWTVIGDGVYGLSTWIPVHPGGAAVVAAMCGIDGTAMFSGKHGGSASAGAILAKIRLGNLVASAAKALPAYTPADVAKHASEGDCWTIVDGKVYDLTAWIPKHPGGKAVIIAMCGTDGSAMYNGKHAGNAGALSALNSFQVGTLAPGSDAAQPAIAASGPIVTLIPASRVVAHKTATNCWTIVNHNVYNLTPWTKRHQGHKAFIKAMCGKNGSVAFNKATGGAAKSNAKLKRFLIGRVGKPAASTATTTGTYTLADVATHKTAANCWTAINGQVYNVTAWAPKHPGGAASITGLCGKDGSSSYNAMHKGSAKAAAALAQYAIGKLN